MEITTSLKTARLYWGRASLPMGAILCGTIGVQALMWFPSSWWEGGAGAINRLEPTAAQRGWLQAVRDDHGWSIAETIGTSRRTWEGWEQGRTIPAEKMLAIYHAMMPV